MALRAAIERDRDDYFFLSRSGYLLFRPS